jgi:DNA-binding LacI/PurR family transcriptional regulator
MTDDKKGFPTAHDVARLAGVSQSAVSRAFTAGASISAKLRTRILTAAGELGYRPNLIARSLTQRRSNVVGLVMGNVDNPFFAQALDRLSATLDMMGCRILLLHAEPNAQVDSQVDELLSYQVRALVLLAVNLSSKLSEECTRAGIPVILFNRTVAGSVGAHSVVGDNQSGGRAIAAHFLETGRRKLAFMAGYAESSTSNEREMAFGAYLAVAGAPLSRRATGHYSRMGAIAATRDLLGDPHDRPDAIFCANDLMAIAAIETARFEFGLEPGREVAIAGFDDIAIAAWPSFSLTTYSQPIDAMVDHTVRLIEEWNPDDDQRTIVVPGSLIVRSTT